MKKKILSLLLCIIIMGSFCVFGVAANEDEPDLTLDFNKRYTNISEYDDVNDPYLDFAAEKEEKEQKRNIYAIILVVLLVIAIIIFIRTLKKTPALPEATNNTSGSDKAIENDGEKSKGLSSLADEEKTDSDNQEREDK